MKKLIEMIKLSKKNMLPSNVNSQNHALDKVHWRLPKYVTDLGNRTRFSNPISTIRTPNANKRGDLTFFARKVERYQCPNSIISNIRKFMRGNRKIRIHSKRVNTKI